MPDNLRFVCLFSFVYQFLMVVKQNKVTSLWRTEVCNTSRVRDMLSGTSVGRPDEELWKTGCQSKLSVTVDENWILADY